MSDHVLFEFWRSPNRSWINERILWLRVIVIFVLVILLVTLGVTDPGNGGLWEWQTGIQFEMLPDRTASCFVISNSNCSLIVYVAEHKFASLSLCVFVLHVANVMYITLSPESLIFFYSSSG